jgi:hypothetical protein
LRIYLERIAMADKKVEILAWVGLDEGQDQVGIKMIQLGSSLMPLALVNKPGAQEKLQNMVTMVAMSAVADAVGSPMRLVRFVEQEVLAVAVPGESKKPH